MWLRAHLNLPTHPRLMVGFSLGRERAIRPGEVARVERGQRGVAATPSASCCERPSRPPSAAATRSWFCLFKAALGALRANCRGATNNHVLRRTISEGQGRHFCARAHACWVSSLVSLLVFVL